jgi:5-methyltetrahydrofolate--homocysteine methyltransferase
MSGMETPVTTIERIAQAIINYDEQSVPKLVEQALSEQLPPRQILEEGLLVGMAEVGRRFREGEYFIPEVLVAAEAMKAGTAVLKPHLVSQGIRAAATAVVGTVRGDLHDIGKNLVATMLEGAGFEVVDLGVDVSGERFVEASREHGANLVGLSALLTTTMPAMETIVKQLREHVQPCPVILVGGAPVTETYAKGIGADGYGRDASTGAELAKRLCLKQAV